MTVLKDFNKRYGPWAIVAGASEGLGAAFAKTIAQQGIDLILIARREEKLQKLSADLREKYGIQIIIHSQDLGELHQLSDYISSLDLEIGLLVYNAASAPIGNFQDIALDQILKIADVNVKAPLLMIKLMSEKMILREKGGIILMSSLSGFQGSPKISTYAATKAFNTILAEGLWKEMKGNNIDILACCAGAVRTPGYQQAQNRKEAPGILDASVVAGQALSSLGKGPIHIPGLLNNFFNFILTRLVPKKTAINIMYNNTKDLS